MLKKPLLGSHCSEFKATGESGASKQEELFMPSTVSGILATYQVASCDKSLKEVGRRATYLPLSCYFGREWSFSVEPMEVDAGGFTCGTKQPLDCSQSANERNKPSKKEASTSAFINHAATAWQENRRKWIGDPSQRSKRMTKDPIISWSTTYEELLSTNEPFSEPIPLPEMVDFLVDVWHVEGLFD